MNSSSGILNTLLGWLPNWLGFLLIAIAGVVAIIFGITGHAPGLVAFGIAAIISAILAWFAGGKSTPDANPFQRSFGGHVTGIDGWVWLVIFGLFVVALLIALFVH